MALPSLQSSGAAVGPAVAVAMAPVTDSMNQLKNALLDPLSAFNAPPAVTGSVDFMKTVFKNQGEKASQADQERNETLDKTEENTAEIPKISNAMGALLALAQKKDSRDIENDAEAKLQSSESGTVGDTAGDRAEAAGSGLLGGIAGALGITAMMKRWRSIKTALTKSVTSLLTWIKTMPTTFARWGTMIGRFTKGFSRSFLKAFKTLTKVFGKFVGLLLIPVTFLWGFINEYSLSGDIWQATKTGIRDVFDAFIDWPLNMVKSIVAWIAGALGFEAIEESLNSWDFDFSKLIFRFLSTFDEFFLELGVKWDTMVYALGDAFGNFVSFLANIPGMIFNALPESAQKFLGGIGAMFGTGVDALGAGAAALGEAVTYGLSESADAIGDALEVAGGVTSTPAELAAEARANADRQGVLTRGANAAGTAVVDASNRAVTTYNQATTVVSSGVKSVKDRANRGYELR